MALKIIIKIVLYVIIAFQVYDWTRFLLHSYTNFIWFAKIKIELDYKFTFKMYRLNFENMILLLSEIIEKRKIKSICFYILHTDKIFHCTNLK